MTRTGCGTASAVLWRRGVRSLRKAWPTWLLPIWISYPSSVSLGGQPIMSAASQQHARIFGEVGLASFRLIPKHNTF